MTRKIITVKYRESFAGSVGHTGIDRYDNADIEMKDGGIWVYYTRDSDDKKMSSFYPNVSIVKIDVEEI